MASADWLGKGRGLGRLAGEGSWPRPIGWGRVVASADWLGKGHGLGRLAGEWPESRYAGRRRVLIGKFDRVSGRLLKGRRRGLRFLRFSRKGAVSGT